MMAEDKNARNDRRSDRTRLLISNALQTLLKKEIFSGITVNDICIEAEVSRATFYLYFEDKYKLLQFTVERWGNGIHDMADLDNLRSLMDAILETLHAHKKEIINILVADKNEEVQGIIHAGFARAMKKAFERQMATGFVLNVPAIALSVFCAGGFTYTILWWLEGSFDASKEQMCDILVKVAEGVAITDPSLADALPA